MNYKVYICLFFFFQAEDGIRDDLVTGVQTCALPIWLPATRPMTFSPRPSRRKGGMEEWRLWEAAGSEERRVGEEGRSRWSPYHLKKKKNKKRGCRKVQGIKIA